MNGAIVPAPNRGKGLACHIRFGRVYEDQPAVVRMTVTQPQKYVVWTQMMFSEMEVRAPSQTACVHSSIGAVPFQSRLKSWSCSIALIPSRVNQVGDSASKHSGQRTAAGAR